jgi:hypothetical protein
MAVPRRRLSKEAQLDRDQKIARLYTQGYQQSIISQRFSMSPGLVKDAIKRCGAQDKSRFGKSDPFVYV